MFKLSVFDLGCRGLSGVVSVYAAREVIDRKFGSPRGHYSLDDANLIRIFRSPPFRMLLPINPWQCGFDKWFLSSTSIVKFDIELCRSRKVEELFFNTPASRLTAEDYRHT